VVLLQLIIIEKLQGEILILIEENANQGSVNENFYEQYYGGSNWMAAQSTSDINKNIARSSTKELWYRLSTKKK